MRPDLSDHLPADPAGFGDLGVGGAREFGFAEEGSDLEPFVFAGAGDGVPGVRAAGITGGLADVPFEEFDRDVEMAGRAGPVVAVKAVGQKVAAVRGF